jgi:hypothetical protein
MRRRAREERRILTRDGIGTSGGPDFVSSDSLAQSLVAHSDGDDGEEGNP